MPFMKQIIINFMVTLINAQFQNLNARCPSSSMCGFLDRQRLISETNPGCRKLRIRVTAIRE
jgi:hypothetical protein